MSGVCRICRCHFPSWIWVTEIERGFLWEPMNNMRRVDEQFPETPWYGSRQMTHHLRREGHTVGRKRVRRLMAEMGLAVNNHRPRTTVP
jgi:hypothetical protein